MYSVHGLDGSELKPVYFYQTWTECWLVSSLVALPQLHQRFIIHDAPRHIWAASAVLLGLSKRRILLNLLYRIRWFLLTPGLWSHIIRQIPIGMPMQRLVSVGRSRTGVRPSEYRGSR